MSGNDGTVGLKWFGLWQHNGQYQYENEHSPCRVSQPCRVSKLDSPCRVSKFINLLGYLFRLLLPNVNRYILLRYYDFNTHAPTVPFFQNGLGTRLHMRQCLVFIIFTNLPSLHPLSFLFLYLFHQIFYPISYSKNVITIDRSIDRACARIYLAYSLAYSLVRIRAFSRRTRARARRSFTQDVRSAIKRPGIICSRMRKLFRKNSADHVQLTSAKCPKR